MSVVERSPHHYGRIAFLCWLISTGLFILAFVVGMVASVIGPGDDSVQTYAPFIFPAATSLVGTPLLVAAVVISIRSFVTEGANLPAIFAHVLSLIGLVPAVFVFYQVAKLLTGNG